MLSDAAQALYRSVLDRSHPPGVDDCDRRAVRELLDLGLVQVEQDRVIALSPHQGQANLADVLHRRTRETLERLTEVSEFLGTCGNSFAPSSAAAEGDPSGSVRVIADPAEVSRVSSELPGSARQGYCSVHTSARMREGVRQHLQGPCTRRSRDPSVRSRILVDPGMASDPHTRAVLCAGISNGEHVRCHPAPPVKFIVVDQSVAMMPLDESGAAGALVVHSATIGALLCWTFEHLWTEAQPLSGARDGPVGLDPVDVRILRLLAEDRSEAKIAAEIGIGERSVRRHTAALTERLGVHSKHAAVAAAFRHGLLT